jgi:chorismate synthase
VRFRFTTAGESHGTALTAIVSGVPAGLRLDRAAIDAELARRQHGYGRGGRMTIESDAVEISSGVRGGETTGSPVALTIANRDAVNWAAAMGIWDVDPAEVERRRLRAPRPGHADLAGGMKYDRRDLRDILERASARETAARVGAGAIAKQLLAEFGVEIRSAVLSIGNAGDPHAAVTRERMSGVSDDSPLRAWAAADEPAMIAAIDRAKEAGDTLGGVVAVVAHGVIPGLGSHTEWDAKLDGRIGAAMLSIPAVKGVAFGDAIVAARGAGSAAHDAIERGDEGRIGRGSNHAGGLEGGITNGEEIVVRLFMKPISTLRRGMPSIDLDSGEPARSQWERSDVTAVPACGVVGEAMLAIVLAGAMREKFGGDSLGEMKRNFEGYREQLRNYSQRR